MKIQITEKDGEVHIKMQDNNWIKSYERTFPKYNKREILKEIEWLFEHMDVHNIGESITNPYRSSFW